MSGLTAPTPRVRPLSLTTALAIMLAATLYPPFMADTAGHADHRLAMAVFWAMSAGFVHGVGFVPRRAIWRWLFSGWAVLLSVGAAAALKMAH